MKAPVALGVLVAMAVGLSASPGNERANAGAISWPPTQRSSRLLMDGRVRCTATVPSMVQVGRALDVGISLHNVSRRPVTISLWVFSAGVVLKAGDGTTYDSGGEFQGLTIPPPIPRTLRAGGWLRLGPVRIPVRWPGPLQVTPGCMGKSLHALRVVVATPWPPPSESTVVDEVVAASGHLLDQCRPQTPGVAVTGTIQPPSGTAPPLNAQCSISITSKGRFLVAQELVVTPPGLAGVQIYQPYEILWPIGSFVGLTASPPYEAIAWEFVVTRDRAIPVAAATLTASNSSAQIVPFFFWNGTAWAQMGEGSCGGTSFAAGGIGPELEFISLCT